MCLPTCSNICVFVIDFALKQNLYFWLFGHLKKDVFEEGIIGLGSFGYIRHWMELGGVSTKKNGMEIWIEVDRPFVHRITQHKQTK